MNEEERKYIEDLNQRVDKAELVHRLKTDKSWKLFEEVADKIANDAIRELVVNTKADDMVKIINLQTIVRKYKYALFGEIDQLVNEGRAAYETLKEDSMLGTINRT